MKKHTGLRSAFLNPRVLITFALGSVAALGLLVAFAIYPGGNALAAHQEVPTAPSLEAAQNIPLPATAMEQSPGEPDVFVANLEPAGTLDMTALGIKPVWSPQAIVTSPDGPVMGLSSAFTNPTSDIVNQSITAAFATLSYGFTPGESVQYFLNGTLASTFTAGATYGYLGVTINTGAGFGFISVYMKGLTSLKESGCIVQVAPTGPYMPGIACAPHAVNTAGVSPALLLFATGYPPSTSVNRFRNGVSTGATVTGTGGTFFILTAPANNGNTSAVYTADQNPGVSGKYSGVSVEERNDAGTPPVGDQNPARAFVTRPVLDAAVGGTFGVSGEGFRPGETVNITGSAVGSTVADANGAATFFLTAPAGAALYSVTLEGAITGRQARATVQAHADVLNRRSMLVAPSLVAPTGNFLVMVDRLPPNDLAQIFLDGVLAGTASTNSAGFASVNVPKPTPGGTPGTLVVLHEVGWIANNGTGDAQATGFLLGPPAGATPTPGPTSTPGSPTPTPGPTGTPTATPTAAPAVCNLPTIGFEDFATVLPSGWTSQNNSTAPLGNNWFQGSTAVFNSQAGAATAYAAANYQSTAGTSGSEIISNWLILPPVTTQTGFNGQMSFWTRTVDTPAFPDRMQVLLSTSGGANTGGTPTSVGDFTTVLADINPALTVGGYPNVWTNFVVTLPSLGNSTVRVAFRYFVTNGGPAGVNSDYIGVDTVAYHCQGGFTTPTPSPTPTPTPTPSPTSTPGPNGCQWSLSTVVPAPIMDNAVASVGGNLYSFAGVSNNAIVANSYSFNGTTWSSIASMPLALEYPAAASDGTNIYIVGGVDNATGNAVTNLYRYNVGLNTYTALAPCATASWNHVLLYSAGKLYKIAGTDDTPISLANVEIYDIGSNTWSVGAPYPVAQSFPMGFAQGGFIYVGGGIDAVSGNETAKAYRYDPGTNTWDDSAFADLPATRWGGAAGFGNCCTGGGVFAGGYSVNLITFTAINWNSGTNTWSSMPNMNGERTRMGGAILGGAFYSVGGRSNSVAAFIGTTDNQRLGCPVAPTANISGNANLCGPGAPTPTPNIALAGVTMTLTGTSAGSTTTDGAGAYQFLALATGGNYTVVPTKTRRVSGSAGINTVDVVGEQNHALNRVLLTGCRLAAGEAAGPAGINTVDVLAIQAFALGRTIPAQIGNVGTYVFSPASRTYTPLSTSQTAQNYDTIILGDVANPVANPRPGGPAPERPMAGGPVASVTLPDVAVARTMSNFTAAVTSSAIDASSNIVAFQGDFTFDERVITLSEKPVQNAGLTAGSWVVDANVLAGDGPIRTLRVSAYSTDMSPLSGSGILFELKVAKVNTAAGSTQLIWDTSEDNAFFFVDADLNVTHPFNRVSGSVGSKR